MESKIRGLWNSALKTHVKEKPVAPEKKQTYKYKEFYDTYMFVDDKFWKQYLLKASKGVFPPNFTYINGVLSHKKSKKSILLPSDPESIYKIFSQFLGENGNIYSSIDLKEKQKAIVKKEEKKETWKDISKNKNKRSIYIREYIDTKYSSLPKSIRDDLYTHINTYYELTCIRPNDIEYDQETCKITYIDGIDADETGVVLTREMNIPNIKIAPKKKTDKVVTHYTDWQKYIKSLAVAIDCVDNMRLPTIVSDVSSSIYEDFSDED